MSTQLRSVAIYSIIAICTGVELKAQGAEPQYLSDVLAAADKSVAKYYRNFDRKAGDHFVGKTYSIEGKLKVEGVYSDKELSIEDGEFVFYYADGKVESRGRYEMGLKSGMWERFDTQGHALAEKIYDPSVLDNIIYTMAQIMPKYKGGDEKVFAHYVKSNVILQDRKRAKGEVTASFIVEKNGELSSIKAFGGKDQELNDKVVEAVAATSPWSVGVEKGRPVRVQMLIPVKF